MIKKILIANRGEIACRIIKTANKMNIKTVAVYSEADKHADFVKLADESYLIGPSSPNESYLVIKKIIEIAKKSKSDAIHPGYGFLSENYNFVKALEKEKIKFIGPNKNAITKMGDKIESKNLANKLKLNIIPGHTEAIKDPKKVTVRAVLPPKIVLVKTSLPKLSVPNQNSDDGGVNINVGSIAL